MNGTVYLCALIKDLDFLDKLDKRACLIDAGDAVDAEITFEQVRDDTLRVFT